MCAPLGQKKGRACQVLLWGRTGYQIAGYRIVKNGPDSRIASYMIFSTSLILTKLRWYHFSSSSVHQKSKFEFLERKFKFFGFQVVLLVKTFLLIYQLQCRTDIDEAKARLNSLAGWHSSRQMNDPSFQKSPDKSQISYFFLCNYIGLFIPVARLESDRLLKHAQSLQLAGDKSHTILPGAKVISALRIATSQNSNFTLFWKKTKFWVSNFPWCR